MRPSRWDARVALAGLEARATRRFRKPSAVAAGRGFISCSALSSPPAPLPSSSPVPRCVGGGGLRRGRGAKGREEEGGGGGGGEERLPFPPPLLFPSPSSLLLSSPFPPLLSHHPPTHTPPPPLKRLINSGVAFSVVARSWVSAVSPWMDATLELPRGGGSDDCARGGDTSSCQSLPALATALAATTARERRRLRGEGGGGAREVRRPTGTQPPHLVSSSCFSSSFLAKASSSLFSLALASRVWRVRKASAEESTTSPDAPASTGRLGVGWVSPEKCRQLRSLLCGKGSGRMPGRSPGWRSLLCP